MEIKEITHNEILNEFVGSQKMSQFLQSWEWGEFQKNLGRRIWRLGAFDDNKIVGSALVIKQALPIGKCYLYCPRGPVGNNQNTLKKLVFKIVSLGKEQDALFIKIEPPIEKKNQQFFNDIISEFNNKLVDFVQPQDSWYLDLLKPEEELLKAMHHKTRYNIRLAEKKGVVIKISGAEDLEKFWQLNLATGQRDQFTTHSKDYYKKMLEELIPSGLLKLFIAEYEGQAIAANIVMFYSDTATYVHGASADENRNVMAPHLLQWRQIQEAKKNGFKYYDFWGIAPSWSASSQSAGQPVKNQSKAEKLIADKLGTKWAGITRFKRGFGGSEVNYVGTYDLILSKVWYNLYYVVKKFQHK